MAEDFLISVEVVPPADSDVHGILKALRALSDLSIDRLSVATNPVAKPRMSALATCALIQQTLGKSAILHCTTRDHNRLSLQGLLWGARALGIETVLAMTGDFVALGDQARITTVRDMDVFGLITLARESGLHTGAVFEYSGNPQKYERTVRRLEKKIDAGAQFIVTQPVYDAVSAETLARIRHDYDIPMILGILPLRTSRHAEFLHQQVAGIEIPHAVRERMAQASNPLAEGLVNAGEMLTLARQHFSGACLMPPFNHYEIVRNILHTYQGENIHG